MFDTMITVVGNVVDSPRKVRVKDSQVTNFRVAATPRRFDGTAQRYVDGTHLLRRRRVLGRSQRSRGRQRQPGRPGRGGGRHQHRRVGDRRRAAQQAEDQGPGRRAQPALGHLPLHQARPRPPWSTPSRPSGVPVDPSDEELGEAVDQLTGEILARPGLRDRPGDVARTDDRRPPRARARLVARGWEDRRQHAGDGAGSSARPVPPRDTTEGSTAQWLSTSTRWSARARRTATR